MSLIAAGTVALTLTLAAAAPTPQGGQSLDEVMRGLDQSGTPAPPAEETAPPPAAPLGDKRPVPRYGVLPNRTSTVGGTLLWVPRAVFYPAYAVAEYGLRRPVVGLVTLTEEHYVVPRLLRVFTWDQGKAGIFPTFGINLGLRPSVGFMAFDDELGSPGTDLALGGTLSRADVYGVSGRVRHRLGAGYLVVANASYASRDDQVFYGIGSDTVEADRVYYARDRLDASLGLEGQVSEPARVAVTLRLRDAHFGASDYRGDDHGIQSHFGGPGQAPLPEGFTDGYTLVGVGTRLVLDSRRPTLLRPSGSGLRFQTDVGLTTSISGARARFADWGGELAGFVDASGHGHVLSLRLAAHFQEALSGTTIPFDEQLQMSRFTGMRAFIDGRLRGQSAVLLEAQYRYPIASLVDAELWSGLGNAFPGHLEGFGPARLYWDYGLTLRTYTSRDAWWGATLAFGSNRLDSESFTATDFVRFSAGFNQGF